MRMHFWKRHAWQAFRLRLLISQSLAAGQVYSMLPVLQIRRERETIKMFVSDEEEKPTTHTHTLTQHPLSSIQWALIQNGKGAPSTLSIGYKQSQNKESKTLSVSFSHFFFERIHKRVAGTIAEGTNHWLSDSRKNQRRQHNGLNTPLQIFSFFPFFLSLLVAFSWSQSIIH